MQWGGLQLDPNEPGVVSPTNPHVTAPYPRPPWHEAPLNEEAPERGLIPQAVLNIVRNVALPPRRLSKSGMSRRKRALLREQERKHKREQRFLARRSRVNSPSSHMLRSPIASHPSTPTADGGGSTPSSVVSRHHHSRKHRSLNARSRTAKSFRKAAGLRLVDTHTQQDVDTSSSSSSSSSSDDDGELPELGALRAQQKEGVALRGTLKPRTPGDANMARKSEADVSVAETLALPSSRHSPVRWLALLRQAARACKAKILQRLTINQRKRRARLKFRLLQGITQPTPVPQDPRSESAEPEVGLLAWTPSV